MDHIKDQITQWVDNDKQKMIDLCSALVKCETPTPPGDTRDAMKLVKDFLSLADLPFKEVTIEPTMPNLIASVQMPVEGRHLMFTGHLDVLPAGNEPGWSDSPWSGKVENGRIWGRGTSDMKVGVTAILFAYCYLSRLSKNLSGRLSITLASDEEGDQGRGTGYMFTQIENELMSDCVLAPEPSGTKAITFSSKGIVQFDVTVTTRGAIAGYPNLATSAIHIAAKIISDLEILDSTPSNLPESLSLPLSDPAYKEKLDEYYGEGTTGLISVYSMNVGTIQGGPSTSVIAPECVFGVTVNIPAGGSAQAIIEKATEIVGRFPEAKIEIGGMVEPDISDPSHEMVSIIKKTVTDLGWDLPMVVPDVAISDL